MNRALLTPFVIAGLLLLPSCSSAEAKVCEAAKEAYISNKEIGDKNINRKTDTSDLGKYERIGKKAYFVANKIIVNNQKCFTPEQVVKAQIAVE